MVRMKDEIGPDMTENMPRGIFISKKVAENEK